MRRVLAPVAAVFLHTTAFAQTSLPPPEQTLIIGVRTVRPATPRSPLSLTLVSGTRITIAPQDVHEAATVWAREELMKQAWKPVAPALLFVLHIREVARAGEDRSDVTLFSGAVIRVPNDDLHDVRLTFLRTALAQAVAAQLAAQLTAQRPRRVIKFEFVIRADGTVGAVRIGDAMGPASATAQDTPTEPWPPVGVLRSSEFPDAEVAKWVQRWASSLRRVLPQLDSMSEADVKAAIVKILEQHRFQPAMKDGVAVAVLVEMEYVDYPSSSKLAMRRRSIPSCGRRATESSFAAPGHALSLDRFRTSSTSTPEDSFSLRGEVRRNLTRI